MLFNSYDFFLLFLPAVLGLYWALRERRRQNLLLLAASYFFYACWDWRFMFLLLFSTAVDFFCGLKLHARTGEARRKRWLCLSLASNLGILGFFKYFDFFSESAACALRSVGLPLQPLILEIILPVGLSFYTLKALGYILDVYRRKIEPSSDFAEFALFIAFFPQLVAGPIERAEKLLPQIRAERRWRAEDVCEGGWLALWGLFKKVVVADNLARLVDPVFDAAGPVPGSELALALCAFSVQLYCDFSGYSDMARGIGRFFGFEVSWNFERPFFSRTPQDFWRRWHVSMTAWFRDYVLLPLCGEESGPGRRRAALLATFALLGLWHGARWNFVLWGLLSGAAVLLVSSTRSWRLPAPGRPESGVWSLARVTCGRVGTFLFIAFSMILFRAESFSQTLALLRNFSDWGWTARAREGCVLFCVLPAPVLWLEGRMEAAKDQLVVLRWHPLARTLLYLFLFYAIVIFGDERAREYVYYQF